MFGFWWIFIIFVGIFIALGVLTLALYFIAHIRYTLANSRDGGAFYSYYHYKPNDTLTFSFGSIGIACLIAAVVVWLPISIGIPISAHQEVLKYQNDYEMIQMVIENGSEYDNVAISQTIINYNSWLSAAKSRKETYDCWSAYVYEDLDSLEYIRVPKKNN